MSHPSSKSIDSNFFLNLDCESSSEDVAEVNDSFQNEIFRLSKDNLNYIEDLKNEMKQLDKLN